MTRPSSPNTLFLDSGFSATRDHSAVGVAHFQSQSEIMVGIQDTGWHEIARGGQRLRIPKGRLGVLWGIIPFHTEGRSDPFGGCVLTLPMPWFLEWQMPTALTAPLLAGHIILDPETKNALRDFEAFASWVEDVQSGDAARRHIVLLEVEARLRRLALAMENSSSSAYLLRANDEAEDGETGNGAIQPPLEKSRRAKQKTAQPDSSAELDKATRMAMHIAQHFAEPLSLQNIADAVGLNRAYAATLFSHSFGLTPLQYLMRHRVWHAQRLLAATDMPIIDVGRDSGFSSESRFYDVFKRISGQPPREYRQMTLPPAKAGGVSSSTGLQTNSQKQQGFT